MFTWNMRRKLGDAEARLAVAAAEMDKLRAVVAAGEAAKAGKRQKRAGKNTRACERKLVEAAKKQRTGG